MLVDDRLLNGSVIAAVEMSTAGAPTALIVLDPAATPKVKPVPVPVAVRPERPGEHVEIVEEQVALYRR